MPTFPRTRDSGVLEWSCMQPLFSQSGACLEDIQEYCSTDRYATKSETVEGRIIIS